MGEAKQVLITAALVSVGSVAGSFIPVNVLSGNEWIQAAIYIGAGAVLAMFTGSQAAKLVGVGIAVNGVFIIVAKVRSAIGA